MIKTFIKSIVASGCSSFDYPLIVNSYGRSGSTVLTKSIINSSIKIENKKRRNIAYRSISQTAWNLEQTEFKDGIVYKTHDYPPSSGKIKENVRMLYTFADPVDVVLSLLRLYDERGEEWMRQHYQHLQVDYGNFEDIVEEDQLRLEKHLFSWLKEDRFPIAFIKYETMWDHQDEISDFLGFKIDLPPFRERKAKKKEDKNLLSSLEKTYSPFKNRLDNLNSYFTNKSLLKN